VAPEWRKRGDKQTRKRKFAGGSRYANLRKAYAQLQRGLAVAHPNEIEQQGIIQSFEFTFELAWKTLKDDMEARGGSAVFPRDVIKQAVF